MVLQAKQVRAEMAKQTVPQFEMRHRMALALEYGDVSVVQMSKELGISRTTISNFLHGRTAPRRSHLIVWALTCGVPFDWLSGEADLESEPEPEPKPTRAKQSSKTRRTQGNKVSGCSTISQRQHIVQGARGVV